MNAAEPRPKLRNNQAAARLRSQGYPISDKTLRNRRCAGNGPPCRYFGSIPLYDPDELDAWAASELREQSARAA
jgi:hypothetical protein